MGQAASSKRRYWINNGTLKKSKQSKQLRKNPLEVWRQIKDAEINQLQGKISETEKELEKVKKQFVCQSFLLKEIFEDALKEQRESREKHNKEIAELRKEIAELRKEIEK
jgi:phage shock protein A